MKKTGKSEAQSRRSNIKVRGILKKEIRKNSKEEIVKEMTWEYFLELRGLNFLIEKASGKPRKMNF